MCPILAADWVEPSLEFILVLGKKALDKDWRAIRAVCELNGWRMSFEFDALTRIYGELEGFN